MNHITLQGRASPPPPRVKFSLFSRSSREKLAKIFDWCPYLWGWLWHGQCGKLYTVNPTKKWIILKPSKRNACQVNRHWLTNCQFQPMTESISKWTWHADNTTTKETQILWFNFSLCIFQMNRMLALIPCDKTRISLPAGEIGCHGNYLVTKGMLERLCKR